jgi:hypothetical protein
MKDVELYARVRYAVQVVALCERGGGAAVWDRSADGRQDDAVFATSGLPAHEAAGEAEAGRAHCRAQYSPVP